MEYWDAYDQMRNKKGYTIPKSVFLKEGDFHLVVHTCVFNKEGKMLVQKRKCNKPQWSGKWDFSSGGAALAGEESSAAAERELFEELQISAKITGTRPVITVHFEQGFDDYYVIEISDEQSANIIYQEKEIDEIKWLSYGEIMYLIDTGEMDIIKSFISVIFDMRKKRGNHMNITKDFSQYNINNVERV